MGAQAARIGERIRKELAHVLKMLVLEIDRELRRLTPVDTGHARRNWIPSVGEPSTVEYGGEASGRDSGGRFRADNSAHAAGVAAVMAYHLSQGALWVANVAPYIQQLNDGWSAQQGAGFVERAIDAAMTTVRGKLARKGSFIDMAPLQAEFRDQVSGDAANNPASAYSPFGGD